MGEGRDSPFSLREKVSRRAGTDEGPSGRCDADPHSFCVDVWGQTWLCAVPRVVPQWVQFPSGNWVAPAGSYRSGGGGDKTVGAFETNVSPWRCSEPTGRNVSERRAGLETTNVDADPAT